MNNVLIDVSIYDEWATIERYYSSSHQVEAIGPQAGWKYYDADGEEYQYVAIVSDSEVEYIVKDVDSMRGYRFLTFHQWYDLTHGRNDCEYEKLKLL